MEETTEAWLKQQALNYKSCLIAVKNNIPPKLDEGLELSAKELKDIASNLFIQGHKSGIFRIDDGTGPPRYPADEPLSTKQKNFIKTLSAELGKEADGVIDQQLRLNGKVDVQSLTIQEATDLITILKETKTAARKK